MNLKNCGLQKGLFVKNKLAFSFILVWLLSACAPQEPALKIGIITDVQYCDCDYNAQWNNDYRQALPRLQEAISTFNNQHVDIVFHLGDFIDRDYKSYAYVKALMTHLKMPYYYVLGNHEFSVADSLKKMVYPTLSLKQPFYKVQEKNWLFVVLDGTDISPYSSNDSLQIHLADSLLNKYQIEGRPQAKPWNGAISKTQLNWLDKTLTDADIKGLNSIILVHFPIVPAGDVTLWNDKELRTLLEHHTSVKAYFNGHDHPGNYGIKKGIHYLTFQAMVLGKKSNAYAIANLYDSKIDIVGFGREPSRTLQLKK